MLEPIVLTVNGQSVSVVAGSSVAAAILMSGANFRKSVSGEPRSPLCGAGICFECRATIDGVPHCRSCQIAARSGMEVVTDLSNTESRIHD